MRVGLIDVDRTSWRNLHLMRRSAYHKAQGDEVLFPYDGAAKVDRVIVSTVFTRNRRLVGRWLELLTGIGAWNVEKPWEDKVLLIYPETKPLMDRVVIPIDETGNKRPDKVPWETWAGIYDIVLKRWHIEIGGTGWNIYTKASAEVEAMKPDYSLYDALHGPADYGQGFTSRGCPRGCSFCVVPAMSGSQVVEVSTLAELRNGESKRIKLMDDNFWANSPTNPWRDRMQEAIDGGYDLSFTQGLDIRFVDEERAHLLHRVRFWNEGFTSRQVTFAFDSPKIEKQYRRGFELLTTAGIKPYQIASFVLMGFESTPEEDMHRLAVLRELKADPFAMVYEPIHGETVPEFYIANPHIIAVYGEHLTIEQRYKRHWQKCKHIQRWCNHKAIWKSITDFEDYEPWKKQQRIWAEQDQQPKLFTA